MELKAYIAPLRKWWWLIVAATVIAGSISYFAASRQPPVFRAQTTLLIGSAINNPNPSGNEFWLSQQLAETYTDIVQREVVRQAVMSELGLSWLPAYAARTVPNTQLIEIAVTDSNPERAMVVANELARQLILQTPTSGEQAGSAERQAFIQRQLDELEINIDQTATEITAKQEELGTLFSARQIAVTQDEIRALEIKLDTLRDNYAALLASTSQGAVNSLSVIEPATVPQAPVGNAMIMTALMAAAIGFSLAAGAAYLLEYLDDTVKSPEDVQAAAQMPTLSGIAEYRAIEANAGPLVTMEQPRSPISEAYRALRTAVLFTNVDRRIRTVLITSAGPSEGKSYTAANLAVVMAQAGHRVLLVDADLRRPTQHRIFKIPRGYGLTDLLVDMNASVEPTELVQTFVNLNKAVVESSQPGLFVLKSGSVPPNPSEVVGSAKMKLLLQLLPTRFDFVIIDSPPTLAVTDAVILSTRMDSVLLVAKASATRRNQLKQAVQRLREVNANLSGVVLNRLTPANGEYYFYYYEKSYYTSDKGDGSGGDGEEAAEPSMKKRRAGGRLRPSFLTRIIS